LKKITPLKQCHQLGILKINVLGQKKNPKKFIEKQVAPNKTDFYFLRARKIGKDVGKNFVDNLK